MITEVLLIISIICFIALLLYALNRRRLVKIVRQQNISLEKANTMKDEFIQNVTHEFHTPLNSITGFTQILADDSIPVDRDSEKEMLNAIYENSIELTQLLDNIVDITNYGAKTPLDIIKKSTPMADIIDHLVSSVVIPPDRNVEFTQTIETPDGFSIETNQAMLERAVILILDNAVKFTTEGYVNLRVFKAKTGVFFAITDTGPGIPKEEKGEIFDRFKKLDRNIQGTGLGLGLCRTIVELLKGNVYIDTTYKDKGTRMIIRLPL